LNIELGSRTINTIAVLNQKGGTDKTTISVHLARDFQIDGYNVLLVDSDPPRDG
jgi:chromosome partitioning protein